MSGKSIVFVLILTGIQAMCLCEQTSDKYIFCAGSTGCIDLQNPAGGAKLEQPTSAPEGVKFFPEAGILTWTPTEKQAGMHVIDFKAAGKVVRQIEIEVKPLKRALFVFAHGDDEFCIMARMKQLIDQGVEVWCVWTVNQRSIRVDESSAAMAKLGIPRERLWFVNFASMGSGAELTGLVSRLAEFIRTHDFQQIYTNAYEGGHIQHDLAHVSAVEAAAAADFEGQIYEFGLYNFYGSKPRMFELIPAAMPYNEIILDDAGLKYMESLVALYPSQKQITALFMYGMTPEQKKHTRYRTVPNWDYTRRPYKGMLKYEVGVVGYEDKKQNFNEYRKIVMDYFAQKGGKKVDKTHISEQSRTPAMKELSTKPAGDATYVKIK